MILLYVTCSGVDEHTDIASLARLMSTYQYGEISVRVSEAESPDGGERLRWLHNFADHCNRRENFVNAALHISHQWAEDMCRGSVAPELKKLLDLRDIYNVPFFKRIRLELKNGLDADRIEDLTALQSRVRRRFVFSYTEKDEPVLRQLQDKGVAFDCLYQAKHGNNKLPETWHPPVFENVLQGYSGGINPLNVYEALGHIALTADRAKYSGCVYIEAEQGLKGGEDRISLDKCHRYLQKAKMWYEFTKWQSLTY